MSSLKEQLLKAGLVKKQEVQKKKKKKTPTPPKKSRNKVSEQTLRTQRAMLKKAKRDRKLNEQRQLEAEQKAIYAQIKQLTNSSKLDRKAGETAYNFSYKNKVKRLYVTEQQQQQLIKGQIAIIALEEELFELVPKAAAEKIAQRDSSIVIQNQENKGATDQDDPYADYQVPDDLTW